MPQLIHDLISRAAYSEGAGVARAVPEAVAVPRTPDDAAALVRWAAGTRAALVPRGSGSGMAGGAVGDEIIVDLSRQRDIHTVNRATRSVAVGPGAIRDTVDAAAQRTGLRLPVDPSSSAFCTIGGMVATNAAGAHTLRYGPMRRWVRALDCVFADGRRAVVRRGAPPPSDVPAVNRFLEQVQPSIASRAHDIASAHAGVLKDSSGYALHEFAQSGELIDLLVGSEGTLALFVGIDLALTPVPGATSSLLATFTSLERAVGAAVRARDAGASACELLDRTFLDVVAEGGTMRFDADVEAVLLAEVEADSESAANASARSLQQTFDESGASSVRLALDSATEHDLWSLRHAASPILNRLDPALKSMQFIEDGAVPPERLPEYVRGVRRALDDAGIRGVIFGHAGDAHVHVNPLVDVRRADWRARVERLLDDVVTLTASLGGTLSGEHGDGRLRTPLLSRVWPASVLELFAQVKNAFDPDGILNPGVKVPIAGQRALGEIKYDPALTPLPAPARAALDAVERERAYATSRLDMVSATHLPD
ncbi:MAG TPA: FAD-binding oxidoreductase [Gemmatimonadaceae bacterium]